MLSNSVTLGALLSTALVASAPSHTHAQTYPASPVKIIVATAAGGPLERVARARSGMSWQPLSNGRLAAGIADIPKYLSAGMNVGMGLDGQASADLADPFENMRTGLYMLRGKFEDPSNLQPIDILRLHTMGSATLMGVADKIGSLEVGKFADFNVIAPPSPIFDAFDTIVFAANIMNLEAVYVGGRRLVDGGRLSATDTSRINSEIEERVSRIKTLAMPSA